MSIFISLFEYILIFTFLFGVFVFFADAFFSGSRYTGPISDHFDGTRFFSVPNPDLGKEKRRMSFLKWLFTMEKNVWKFVPVEQSKPQERVLDKTGVVTFINHATTLIQTEGLNILTDPIWAKRASPISFFGPKRYQNPGVSLEDVPKIDVILLSHNHYDHMDIDTLRFFSRRDGSKILTHLGNSEYLIKKGILHCFDMDWWDTHTISSSVGVTSIPAQHFSARALTDRNKTLWGGFVVSTQNGDIYFAADTGYGPFSKQIQEKFPAGFRFGILPVGAFAPRFFMREMHMSPDDAYILKDELKIQKALAIHLGTFKLAGDTQTEPKDLLTQISMERGDDSFVVLKNGESLEF
jgi:L-ascorbate metabolism protein UlaG (beta-lactamase superfamily)